MGLVSKVACATWCLSALLSLFAASPKLAVAASACSTSLILSEIKVRNDIAGYDEFIEVYNCSFGNIDLSQYTLRYFNTPTPSSSQTPVEVELAGGALQPGQFFTMAKQEEQITDSGKLNLSGLADSGGKLQLVNPDNAIIDEIAWTSTASIAAPPIIHVPSNSSDKSIIRGLGVDGLPITSVSNWALGMPSPQSSALTELEDTPEEEETGDEFEYLELQITELFPDPVAPQTDAEHEFVEIFNPNTKAVNLDGYIIKTGNNFQYQFVLPGIVLGPGAYYSLFASESNLTLANGGSKAQVYYPDGLPASEVVEYGDSVSGSSWAVVDGSWMWTTLPTPSAVNVITSSGGQATKTTNSSLAARTIYEPLVITEVFVDPDSPQKDSEDEFIEIYNPNAEPVQLKGYVLRSGSNLKTKFSINEGIIEPGQYKAFFNRDANISLSNSGGTVRLEDANGGVISTIDDYDKAEAGDVWAKFNDGWKWSSTPTPNAPNVLTISVKDTKKAKAVAAKAKKASNSKNKAAESLSEPASIPTSPLTVAVVAGAVGLALLYGLYEFRYDIRNRFELARRYITHRWHTGP